MNVVSDALFTLVKQQVIKLIVSKLPILGASFFNPLLSFVVGKILKIAFEETELAIYFLKVDHETKKQAEELGKAQDNLSKATDPEEIKRLEKEVIEKAKELIKFRK